MVCQQNLWGGVGALLKRRNIECLVKWNQNSDSTLGACIPCMIGALNNYFTLSNVKRWWDLPKRVTMMSLRKGNQKCKKKSGTGSVGYVICHMITNAYNADKSKPLMYISPNMVCPLPM